MDAENDNDQPNSSSASASSSSSNNSSSSNLLGHLPMLPFMRSTDDDEQEADGEEADGHANDLNEEPMPLQPPVTVALAMATTAAQTASASVHQPTLAPITTTVSTSTIATDTSTAATIATSAVGREEPMVGAEQLAVMASSSASSLPPSSSYTTSSSLSLSNSFARLPSSAFLPSANPSQQQHQASSQPPPPPIPLAQPTRHFQQASNTEPILSASTSSSVSATLQQQSAAGLSQQDQEQQLTAQINRSVIAETIDASAVIVQPLEANAEDQPHTHLYPQEAAISAGEGQQQNDIHLDDNDNNDFDVDLNLRNDNAIANAAISNHQQTQQQQQDTQESASLDNSASGSAGPSSSGQQQQTSQPPTTLPLMIQQQQQQPLQEQEQQTEESKHLPSFDHRFHNLVDSYLNSDQYLNPRLFPYGYRSSEQANNQQSNGAVNTSNNNIFGNTMSSDRNHGSTTGLGVIASSTNTNPPVVDRLKLLYPNVNENETPLPRCWSAHDKRPSIGLSQNNLRVHFKGVGTQNNDAASVRTAHPIPPACGIYYFEVKIISKRKNGYVGIGLTAQQFRTNRLPGWDKQSYGYHGDDGNSFSSSGHGQSYGPIFTTGDIIGCCVNFVNNTCFYTKNGVDLGIAFRELPTKLYPTIGLQAPGEEVDANFGQEPFKFDQIEEMMKQMRGEIKAAIYDFPLPAEQGDPTILLQKMVNSYLVHNGYSQTAEAFARQKTLQNQREDMTSIRNRQKILKLVMSGRMGQAIEHTMRLYPGLLENNKNLWFMLKCRQFIEMINGSDVENGNGSNNSTNGSATADATTSTTETTATTTTNTTNSSNNTNNSITNATSTINNAQNSSHITVINTDNDLKTQSNLVEHCTTSNDAPITISKNNNDNDYLNDVEMENNGHTNGNVCKNGDSNNFNDSIDADEEMDVDVAPSVRKYSHGIERILDFGKDLSQMGQQLEKENKMTDDERQMLEDAFSLIAYSNPWASPLGWQLCPTKRETVCRALNSAILESMNYPKWPPLEYCVAHANELLKVMAQASLGACAFVNIADVFPKN